MFIIFGQFRNTKTAKVLAIVLGILAALPLIGALVMLLIQDEMIIVLMLLFMAAIFGFFFLIALINWLTCRGRDRKKAETQKVSINNL